MKYLLLLVLCSASSFNTAQVLLNSVEDYYWRDYQGLVPSDAISGGNNQYGEIAYIGQINVPNDRVLRDNANEKLQLMPAIVTNGEKTVIGPYSRTTIKSREDSNVKILCTQHPESYSWHNHSNIVKPGCRYVVVGQENMIPLYVGQNNYKNLTLFGTVYSDYHYGKRLYIPYEGGQLKLDTFRTLMYCY